MNPISLTPPCCAPQTPLNRHIDVWCSWAFRDFDRLGEESIEISFDINCCQGLLLTDLKRENAEEQYPLTVRGSFSSERFENKVSLMSPQSKTRETYVPL